MKKKKVAVPLMNEMVIDWDTLFRVGACPKCKSVLNSWEAYFDADSPDWHTECCGQLIQATPKLMEIIVEKLEEE